MGAFDTRHQRPPLDPRAGWEQAARICRPVAFLRTLRCLNFSPSPSLLLRCGPSSTPSTPAPPSPPTRSSCSTSLMREMDRERGEKWPAVPSYLSISSPSSKIWSRRGFQAMVASHGVSSPLPPGLLALPKRKRDTEKPMALSHI